MNRTTALLLVIATLLAHCLAMHLTVFGDLAAPSDPAYVAFRIARNFVQNGYLAWSPDSEPFAGYPSPLWLLVCVVPERLYLSPGSFTQAVGILSALATAVVLSAFSPGRLAGVIAPMLLVVSGSIAAAACNGTETTLFMLLFTSAFLAYERRRRRALAICLVALWATRPEGLVLAACFAGFELWRRLRGRRRRDQLWRAFVPLLVVVVVVGVIRVAAGMSPLSATARGLARFDGARLVSGLFYLRDFALSTGSALLVVFPLWYLVRGSLIGEGRRALLLSLTWTAVVVWEGGDELAFGNALVPVLPILFIAVQDSMTFALDSRRPGVAAVSLGVFALAVVFSVAASKLPSDLGPIHTRELMRRWMRVDEASFDPHRLPRARLGVATEIRRVERLRAIGVFLRDRLDPGATILSPWPGTLGYLSRKPVYDLLGRVTPVPGEDDLQPWYGPPRVDLSSSLSRDADYVVVHLQAMRGRMPAFRKLLERWSAFDSHADVPGREQRILRELAPYELVSVPVLADGGQPVPRADTPFLLLRRSSLELGPDLEIQVEGDTFRVLASQRGHHQLANLAVRFDGSDGSVRYMRPTGVFDPSSFACARVSLLLYETGSRFELVRGRLPEGVEPERLVAVLLNPGANIETEFGRACEPALWNF